MRSQRTRYRRTKPVTEAHCIAIVDDNIDRNISDIAFVETQPELSNKWEKPVVTYALIDDTGDIEGDTLERRAVNLAMTSWDFEIPLTLKVVKANEDPDITVEFRTDDPYWKDRPTVLAYAYYPGTSKAGTVVFNDAYTWSLDGEIHEGVKTYNMIHVLLHEFGHSLGLTHDTHDNTNDVMDPYYSGKLMLSPHDIERITAKYGKRTWRSRWYKIMKRWLARRMVRW